MNIHIFAGLGIKGLKKHLIKILEWIASENGDGMTEGIWWGRNSSFCTFQSLNHANN